MGYTKLMSTAEPGCILILIDQSGSMEDPFAGMVGTKKQQECAKAVNRVLRELVVACQAGETIKPRCYVGAIGYGGNGAHPAFGGALNGKTIVRVDELATSPVRVDEVTQRVPDGAGATVDTRVPFPVWIEPLANGGTPMDLALQVARTALQTWIDSHQSSFPPVVINITDGEPDTPETAAEAATSLKSLATSDGNVLLLNAHISATRPHPISLPATENSLPDAPARLLFSMSSVLPDTLRASAKAQGFDLDSGARGFLYNADADNLIRLLRFGSQPTGAR